MKRFLVALFTVFVLMIQVGMVSSAAVTQNAETYLADAFISVDNSTPWVGMQGTYCIGCIPEDEEVTITWSSSDESVATIDQNGVYTALKVGVTKISAAVQGAGGSRTFESELRVSAVVIHIGLDCETKNLYVGETFQMEADVYALNQDFEKISWSSARPNVATIDENGLVTAHMPSSTYIEAKATDGSDTRAFCLLNIVPESYPDTGVQLYKNNEMLGHYANINEAFDLMTDKTADYMVVMCEHQLLQGYAQWPEVKSIKITPALSVEEYGSSIYLYLSEENTVFHSDVTFSDWMSVVPWDDGGEYTIFNINLQSYTLVLTEELVGHEVNVGEQNGLTGGNGGFHIKGDAGSKIKCETSVHIMNCSIDVDVLEGISWARNFNSSVKMWISNIPQDCTVKTLIVKYDTYEQLKISGMREDTIKFVIEEAVVSESAEQRNPLIQPWIFITNNGYADIELKKVASDVEVDFLYDQHYRDDTSWEKGTFAYTGKTIPKNIKVGITVPFDMACQNPEYSVFSEEHELLYAPYVPSECVQFSYSTQGNLPISVLNASYIYSMFSFNGSYADDNGYYYTKSLPYINLSQPVFVIGDNTSEVLTYSGANKNGNLKSVTWTAKSSSMSNYDGEEDTTDRIIGDYDEDSLSFTYEGFDTDTLTYLCGTFDYGDSTLEVIVAVVASAPARDVSFEAEEMEVYYSILGTYYLDINYTADEEPIMLAISDNYQVVPVNFRVEDDRVCFHTLGLGTATIRAYVGGETIECKVTSVGFNGWAQAYDGNFYYYKDSVVDTSVNGIVYNESEDVWWYTVAGKADFEFSGTVFSDGIWYNVERGYATPMPEATPTPTPTSLPAVTPAPNPAEQVEDFVERMYTVALGRGSDPEGLSYWAAELISKKRDGAGLAVFFLLSEEFTEKGYSDSEYVDVLYATFFDRPADDAGNAYWCEELAVGKSRASILSGFVNSQEFFDICADFGISRGVLRSDGSAINPGIYRFSERLYSTILERGGDKGGIEYWTCGMDDKSLTPEEAAISFFFSEEYTSKNTSDEMYIKTLYRTFMDREADEGGLNHWKSVLDGEGTRQGVLRDFAWSPEFKGIMAEYGL